MVFFCGWAKLSVGQQQVVSYVRYRREFLEGEELEEFRVRMREVGC